MEQCAWGPAEWGLTSQALWGPERATRGPRLAVEVTSKAVDESGGISGWRVARQTPMCAENTHRGRRLQKALHPRPLSGSQRDSESGTNQQQGASQDSADPASGFPGGAQQHPCTIQQTAMVSLSRVPSSFTP